MFRESKHYRPSAVLGAPESAILCSKRRQSPLTPLTLCDSKGRMSDQDASGSANARRWSA